MPITIQEGPRRIRAWCGELPPWTYPSSVLKEERPAGSARLPVDRSAALEYLAIGSPVSRYGGLGAAFEPRWGGVLVAEVHVAVEPTVLLSTPMARMAPPTHAGIPHYWGREILEVATSDEAAKKLGAGKLLVARGIYSEVGSTLAVFEALMMALVELLLIDPGVAGEGDVVRHRVFGILP